MAVHYRRLPERISRDNEYVSNQWFVLLYNVDKYSEINFNVNEGHRTLARQAQLVKEKGLWNPISNPHGAARPSRIAPHIRTGRPDHAIDVDGADALIRACKRRGVTLRRTVRGEPWHLEADAADLSKYYRENHKKVFAAVKKR